MSRAVGWCVGIALSSFWGSPPGLVAQDRTSRATPADTLDRTRPVVKLPELRALVRARSDEHVRMFLDRATARLRGDGLGDWLRAFPGLTVRGRGAGGPEHVSIRGSRPQDVRITLDGIPLADPLTGAADLSMLPASTLASAEVVVGAGSSAAAGATAGTVALRSRDAAPGLRWRGVTGSYGRRAGELEAGARSEVGSFGFFGRLSGARNDYLFRNRIMPGAPLERRVNADATGWSALARARLAALPIAVIARADGLERGAPGRMGNHVWDDARWRERRFALSASWEAGTGARSAVSWARRSNRFLDPRYARDNDLEADQLIARGEGLDLAGLDVAWEGAWATVRGDGVESTVRRTAALRVSGSRSLARRLELSHGLAVDAAREGVALSPSLGLRWRLGRAWDARIRGSQARRLPTFADLFLRPGVGARPNPDLRPERVALDADAGIRRVGPGWRTGATFFYRRTNDPIVWLPSVVAIWTPRNLGRLDAVGVELSGSWYAGAWRLTGEATWQSSRITFPDDARSSLPYEPALSGSLAVEHTRDRSGARGELVFVGRRKTSIFGPHDLRPYALLNVRGRQTFHIMGLSAEVELGVLNALDATYERVELFPEPGRRFELGLGIGAGPGRRLPPAGRDRSFREPGSDVSDPSRRVDRVGHAHTQSESGPSQRERTR
ncbi:MAG: TonB-dependent receptor [Gemmatimonadetes bacterium]|nr:TonB-dependent receptor [Gemmatimonadota bacterium]